MPCLPPEVTDLAVKELDRQHRCMTLNAMTYPTSPLSPSRPDTPPFRQLFLAFPQPVALHEVIYDHEHRPQDLTILEANEAFRTLFDLPREGVIGRDAGALFEVEHHTYLSCISQVKDTGLPAHIEIHVAHSGNDFTLTMFPLDEQVLATMLTDITRWKRMEQEQQQHYSIVNDSLHGAVSALSTLSAWRDPYTASHQARVATLARAIGQEIGMSSKELEGLYIAGLLHDIGKVAVPIEILCKPGKITTNEFGIIRSHPQVGYDILHGINFPWPIADIVRQHHARLDGSGYPDAIPAETITMPARILAVADVVEAIASHRPYRPSLGWAAALREVTEHAGELYDAKVVAACHTVCSASDFPLR